MVKLIHIFISTQALYGAQSANKSLNAMCESMEEQKRKLKQQRQGNNND